MEGSRVGAEEGDLKWTGGNSPQSAEAPEVGTSGDEVDFQVRFNGPR